MPRTRRGQAPDFLVRENELTTRHEDVEGAGVSLTLRHPHEDLTFMSPLSEVRASRLTHFLTRDLEGTVLDVGCGWGELLLRVVQGTTSVRGIGIDVDQTALARARVLARQRGIADRVTFLERDGAQYHGAPAQAALGIGASQAWAPPGAQGQPLDYDGALCALRSRLDRGARLVFGEGIWSRPPTAAATASLGGGADEFVGLAALIDIAGGCGYAVVAVHEATLDEWDAFESGYGARYAAWLADHPPEHPDAEEVRRRAALQRDRYFGGYRGVLGMAYLCLLAI